MNINRDYLVMLNVKNGNIASPKMYFYNTDINTSNIYVQLVIKENLLNVSPIENATDYKIKVNIVKPNNVIKIIDGALVNEEESIFEFDLPEDCINLSGVYKLEFVVSGIVSNREEKITSLPTEYIVNKSILTDLNASTEESDDYPILLKLIEDVKTLQGGGEVDISQFVTEQELNGMFSFNESGELVVTINGVTKTFVPK